MFFDALFSQNGVVLFNGTPEETKKFIRTESASLDKACYVMQGATLSRISMPDYVKE